MIDFSLFFFFLSLFFPIRHVFLTPEAYLTGQYSDFTSFSLYLSDILLLFVFLIAIYQYFRLNKSIFQLFSNRFSLIALIIWLILGLIMHFSSISLYWTVKWLELIVAYGTVKLVISEKGIENRIGQSLAPIFVAFSAVQSIIALLQFYKQTSLGLYRLGESYLGPNIIGVAKIIVDNQAFIRGYGTFPHPNVLGGFLTISILISIFLYLNSTWKWRTILGIIIFLNILGLTITFSRAAYLALAIGLLIFFSFLISCLLFRKGARGEVAVTKLFMVIVTVIVSSTFSFLLFRPYLLSRAVIKDNTLNERMLFNQIGLSMIKSNLIFGVGAGESVLHMEQYSKTHLEPWQKQPIHNYFIISAAELGIPGTFILIWILISHLKLLINKLRLSLSTKYLLLTTLLLCIFILMLFDHYFYTLQQTQLLLWLTLGVIAATKKEASVS